MASNSQQQGDEIGSSASASNGSIDELSLQIQTDDAPPLWKFVTKLENLGQSGGTWKYKCNFCNEIRSSSYFRVKAHLLQIKGQGIAICKKVPRSEILKMQSLDEEFERKKIDSRPREVPLPSESQMESSSLFKKRKSNTSPITRFFGVEARDQLDQEIARMFYTGGLPFNLARNPHYMRSYTFVATHAIAGYKPLGYNKLRTTLPIYEMIRYCDTDKPCLHLVYEMWDSMIEQIKHEIYKKEGRHHTEESPFYDVIHEILVARWTKNNTRLHCLAHSLNPRFYSDEWLIRDSTRVALHKDGEISRERMKCFRRLFAHDGDHSKVMNEYALFSMKSGPFEDLTCISNMFSMDLKSWWANFGAQTPLLQSLAFKVLGQPTSSSCCERNWSTYTFIHSLRRNKLNPSRAQDLVFIHNNLRLLSRNSAQYEEDNTKMWDVGGDVFDSIEDIGFLEFADLSLDEPDFENELLVKD